MNHYDETLIAKPHPYVKIGGNGGRAGYSIRMNAVYLYWRPEWKQKGWDADPYQVFVHEMHHWAQFLFVDSNGPECFPASLGKDITEQDAFAMMREHSMEEL